SHQAMGRDRRKVITAVVTATVISMFATAAAPPLFAVLQGAGPMPAVAAETGTPLAASDNSAPLALRGDAMRLTLAPPEPKGPPALAARLQTLAPHDQIYLVLERLNITGATAIGYDVFFDLPEGAKPDTQSSHYVGNFNFFDAE